MNEAEFDLGAYYPIFAYLILLIGFAAATLIVAHQFGPRHDSQRKQVPYESGMDPVGDARQRFDIKFYLVAIMFLVFDVELLFLYPWAVVAYAPTDPSGHSISYRHETPSGPISSFDLVREQKFGFPDALKRPVFWTVMTFIALLLLAYLYDWKKGVFQWR